MEAGRIAAWASLVVIGACIVPPTEVGGESVQAGAQAPPTAPAGWNPTCSEEGVTVHGDGMCDCGCGIGDPDCGDGGCTTPSCRAEACEYCWDGAGASTNCAGEGSDERNLVDYDKPEGDGEAGGDDGTCADYDWVRMCFQADCDGYDDQGDGCCDSDPDHFGCG